MYRYRKKASSVLFSAMLVLGIILFTIFGGTFAYFQINKEIEAQYTLGKVDAFWYNGVEEKEIQGPSVNLALEGTQIVRGDNKGVNLNILATESSTTAGDVLCLRADKGYQYARIKFKTYIYYTDTSTEVEVNIKDDISFRIIGEDGTLVLGGEGSPWIDGEDGWYYYSGGYLQPGDNVKVCNNIFLASSFDDAYLGQQLRIEFIFETIQAANNAVDVWGEDAKNALGLTE